MERVRIATLGAARITPMALLRPARKVPEVEVTAVAARDQGRAAAFAKKHGIANVRASYDELLADPDVDAIYNPLPNGLHHRWTMKALEAGKHVLCEKPFTSNAAEAEDIRDAAAASDRVVMEAFHWRYHPLAARMKEIVDSGALGQVEHIETWMCVPLPMPRDIRYRYDLAGGATMDVGAYAINILRWLAGEEPTVESAEARLMSPDVDRCMTAEMSLPSGASGRINCSLLSRKLVKVAAHVRGDRGEMRVLNPVLPQLYHRLKVTADGRTTSEKVAGDATYTHQLRAFSDAVREGKPTLSPPEESVANMRVIDSVYEKAGLPPRGQTR